MENENEIEVENIIIDPVAVNEPQQRKEKNFKKKHEYGKIALLICLVAGFGIGNQVTMFQMKSSIVDEVTQNVLDNTSIPVNSSSDSQVDPVSVSNSNIVASVLPSVVSVGILGPYSSNSLVGAGTGVVFDQDDTKTYIVTNNHVIEGASGVNIWFSDSEDAVSAKLVGTAPQNDLAVISVLNEDLSAIGIDEVVPCTFGNSDDVNLGDSVLAIGNAMGEGISTTGGMISNKNKTITESNGAEINVLQTDASINPGNSGGALVNSKGEVIGINTAKMAQTFNNSVEGVGYAIPSNDVVEVIDDIMESADAPYLGITGFTIDDNTAKLFSLPEMGVFVKNVTPEGSADNAGIQPNDVITSFNNQPVPDIETLQELIKDCEVGDKVPVIVYRDGETVEITATMLAHDNSNF